MSHTLISLSLSVFGSVCLLVIYLEILDNIFVFIELNELRLILCSFKNFLLIK